MFGATEVSRWTAPDGRIGHAELELAGGRVRTPVQQLSPQQLRERVGDSYEITGEDGPG